MPTVTEDYDSPKFARDERGAMLTRTFTVVGRHDPVLAVAEPGIPQQNDLYGLTALRVTNVSAEPLHADEGDEKGSACRVTVAYKTPEKQEKDTEDETEETFEVGTQQEHIVKALGATHYPDDADAVGLSINASIVRGEPRVEGVDIHAGVTSFSLTVTRDKLEDNYKVALAQKVATVNDDDFRGFAAGEVLFAGASARRRGKGPWVITYHFLVSRNAEFEVDLASGKKNVTKAGWQYFWVDYLLGVTANEDEIKWQNRAAHVDDVYPSGKFDDLEIPA